MNRIIRRMKLFHFLILFDFILIASTILFTILFSFSKFQNILLTQISYSRVDTLTQISERINLAYQEACLISNLYYYDDQLDTIIETTPKYLSSAVRDDYNFRLKSLFQSYRNSLANFQISYYLVLACNNGYTYTNLSPNFDYNFQRITEQPFYQKLQSNDTRLTIGNTFSDQTGPTQTSNVIVFGRMLHNFKDEQQGFLLVNVYESCISNLYEALANESEIYIINPSREIISTNNKALLGESYTYHFGTIATSEQSLSSYQMSDNYLTTSYDIPALGLTLVERMPVNIILSPIYDVFKMMLVFGCGIMIILTTCAYVISKSMVSPLDKLCKDLERVGQGDLNTIFQISGWYEIGRINDSCNWMLSQINSLVRNIKQSEAERQIVETNFLRAKINPHFIYNTLFSISCHINLGNTKESSQMLVEFISLMRWTFQVQDEFGLLSENIEYLKKYIHIMEGRFGQKLDVEYYIDPTVEHCKINNFILQPIVENAIFHGIEPSDEACTLIIEAYRLPDEDMLRMIISDTGVGMTEDVKNKILSSNWDSTHYSGMSNVLDRLKLSFKENFSLTIETSCEGTIIELKVPLIF